MVSYFKERSGKDPRCRLYIHYSESSKSQYIIITTASFQEGQTRNCSFIYKKVKMKGGLGWMKKYRE